MNHPTLSPQAALQQHFGWDEFKPGQLDVVERLLADKSSLAVFPTGGGKSLCYQLPALMLDGLTVVVSPLIALMKDQIDPLVAKGVAAIRLDSSLTTEEYHAAVSQIRSGEAKLLYVAPERFFNERFRGILADVPIALFAIDEAHCISQWGHNFRPDYLKLCKIAEQLNVERVLCLTATAIPSVQQDIQQAFQIADEDVICTPFFRSNLHLRSQVVTEDQRDQVLVDRIQTAEPGATIVYVTLQQTAQRVADYCQSRGLDAKAYHAGMDADLRSEIQDWFMAGDHRIVVATIAFGMGIDKADIRYVYHYNPPKSLESYAQEIGRAGRDGQESRCEALLVPEDRIVLENFVYGDTPSLPSLKKFIQSIAAQPDQFFISTIKFGNDCDIRQIVVKTLLTYLELDGYLQSTSPRYTSYSFKPNITGEQLLSYFEGERQQFVKRLLACSRKRKTWFGLDVDEAIKTLRCDRSRIVKALDYFAEQNWIELRSTGLVHGYRKLKPIADGLQLATETFERLEAREANEIDRVGQVLEILSANQCQANYLSAHFGQPRESECGTCSFCTGDGRHDLDLQDDQSIDGAVLSETKMLIGKHPQAFNTPRAAARFLCGIRSPGLTKAKLSRHALFGSCQQVPFATVKQQLAEFFGE